MKNITVEAIILGRKNYGEADRLVFAFTKELGKISFVAKGCRKIKSKLACHLEPFTLGKYTLVKGSGSYVLAGAESEAINSEDFKNLDHYEVASYLCEITELASGEVPNSDLFQALSSLLGEISTNKESKIALITRYYEFLILKTSGYLPSYHSCKKCGQDLVEIDFFRGDFEGFHCCNCTTEEKLIHKNTLKILRSFEKKSLSENLALNAGRDELAELAEVILPFLYAILPRAPKSQRII